MARRLLFLNGLAAIGLVLNHASGWVFIGMFWWTHRYRDVTVPNFDELGSPAYYALRVIEQLVAFTVPSFLFVSGFFVAFASGREPLGARWTGVGRRLATLLVPYLLWSTVMLLERFWTEQRYTTADYLRIYLTGRAADPYYYVPLLCQCLLLAPLLIELGKAHWRPLLVVTAAIQAIAQALRYRVALGGESSLEERLVALTPSWFLAGKIFWFAFGLVVGLHLETFQKGASRYRWQCAGLAALLAVLGVVEWEVLSASASNPWIGYFDTLLDSVYAAMVIVAVMAFAAARGRAAERIGKLGSQSYGIYLVHSVVLMYAARGVYGLMPPLLDAPLAFFAFLVAAGLGLPLAAMNVLKRSPLRGAYRYVFG